MNVSCPECNTEFDSTEHRLPKWASRAGSRSITICPECELEFEPQELKKPAKKQKSVSRTRPKLDEGTCIQCKEPIAGEPLLFGAAFACESCVRKNHEPYGEGFADIEVRERKKDAAYMLANRKKA